MSRYIVATLTGSVCVDASGRSTGPEVARILSRHRTLTGAYRAQRAATGYLNAPAILCADHSALSAADADELACLRSGYRPA